jgi:aspartyl-tRNA synthetase
MKQAKGPIANALGIDKALKMKALFNLEDGDALFFSCANENEAANLAGKARVKIATDRELIEKNIFKFCWVVDYPDV